MPDKRWLIVCQSPPYVNSLAIAGIDAAMAASAFGQPVTVLFRGLGVHQLCASLVPPEGERHVGKTLLGLPLYDIEQIYGAERDRSLASGGLLDLDITWADDARVRQLIADSDHVVSF